MKNITMKTIKNWLTFGITFLLVVVLFGVIFIKLDLAKPNASFFLELGLITCLTLVMRIFWYDLSEDKRLNEKDLLDEKDKYFKMVDDIVEDTNDLDKYLAILNQENREHAIRNYIGARTAKSLAKKTRLLCLFHPKYKKLTEEEIGILRYDKLYYRAQRKADKLRKIKSEEIMALSESEYLYDAKNYTKSKKRTTQIISTTLSMFFAILIASVAFKEIMLNWTNVFRYILYLFSMTTTIAMTVIQAYKITGSETFDWYNRLKHILDKYACYKEKKEVEENAINNSVI